MSVDLDADTRWPWQHTQLAAVLQLLRTTGEQQPGPAADSGFRRRTAALAAAYHGDTGAGWVFGWVRPHPGAPITVLTTSTVAIAGADGLGGLRYPAGSRGAPLPTGHATALLTALGSWTRIGFVFDHLAADQDVNSAEKAAGSGWDELLDCWHDPFAVLVLATPLPAEAAAHQLLTVAEQELQARAKHSPRQLLEADRHAARLRELRAGQTNGLWTIHVLAGAVNAEAALSLGGLAAASLDLPGLPYRPVPARTSADLHTVLLDQLDDTITGAVSPVVAGSPLLAAVAHPPTVEVPGVRLVQRPTFDVTAETGPDGLGLGVVLDRTGQPAGTVSLSASALVRHTLVVGATGSGKTTTIRHLLTQASHAGVPWLVIEPAKAEYRSIIGQADGGNVVVIRPGDLDSVPVGINPLKPADGFPLATHLDLVRALFTAAFRAEEPFPQILSAALRLTYQRAGWDITLSEPTTLGVMPRWPTLADLQHAAEHVVKSVQYGPEVQANVTGFMRVRLGALQHGGSGAFFTSGRDLDMDKMLRRNVIVELEDLGDDQDKAFAMGALLLRLTEHLRSRQPGETLKHLTVVEEAHRLLANTRTDGPAAHSVETFANMLAEVRAYGEGLIIADQIPTKLVTDVIRNTSTKIVHRLPSGEDRKAVGDAMNLTDTQSSYLVTVPLGQAAVFTDGMDHPVLTAVPPPNPATTPGVMTPAVVLTSDTRTGCPTSCHTTPCRLRDLAAARRTLTNLPGLTIWAEVTTVGHLIGLPAPQPSRQLADQVRALPVRLRDCAMLHAVEQSVLARHSILHRHYATADLTAHVIDDLRNGLESDNECADDPDRWSLPAYRLGPVRLALGRMLKDDPHASRHPDTARWEQHHCLQIPGENAAEQLLHVTGHIRHLADTTTDRGAVLFGDPPILPVLLGATQDSPQWPIAVGDALRQHTISETDWPQTHLATLDSAAVGYE